MGKFIIGAMICACTIALDSAHADVRCYMNPMMGQVVCEDRGHVRPWIAPTPQQQQPGITIIAPREREVRKHDPSECTIATGCIPRRNHWDD